MKVWNKNTNDPDSTFFNCPSPNSFQISLDSTDVIPKQNGINESSSSFIPHLPSLTTNDDNDNHLIIGSTILPATIPLIIEPKELNDDDQLEIVSSPQINKNLSKPTEMEDTPPSVNELMITENSKLNEDDDNITDNTINQELIKEISPEEQMDTDQTTGSNDFLIKID